MPKDKVGSKCFYQGTNKNIQARYSKLMSLNLDSII